MLVAEVTDLAPGRALDVGCGEGADAIWLARHGWDVTATPSLELMAGYGRGAPKEAEDMVPGNIFTAAHKPGA